MTFYTIGDERVLTFHPYLPEDALSLADVEAVRLIIRGDSVVDWHRLEFENLEEVDNFLRVNLFDPAFADDKRRFSYLHQEAVQYLKRHFKLNIPRELCELEDIRQLFLWASDTYPRFRRFRPHSCIILKVMSILHHIEARALLHRTRISDEDVFALVDERVQAFYELAQRMNVPVVDLDGGSKSRDSLLTKLLSKADTIAATIFDKHRYRIVVERYEDLIPVLAFMTHTLFPYNYAIPTASYNNLLSLKELVASRSDLMARMDGKRSNYLASEDEPNISPRNVFSGATYQMISFIVDLPVRLDPFLSREDEVRYGRIGFAMVEFQVVDQNTEEANEQGENSHEAYKRRQRESVLTRLRSGNLGRES